MRILNWLPVVAAAAIVSGPAFAQDTETVPPSAEPAEPATGAALTAEQQAQHDAWPADTQAYFQSLTPDRQELFWRISDDNKLALTRLPPEQQDQAWAQIESQAAAVPADPPAADPPADEAAPTDEPR